MPPKWVPSESLQFDKTTYWVLQQQHPIPLHFFGKEPIRCRKTFQLGNVEDHPRGYIGVLGVVRVEASGFGVA